MNNISFNKFYRKFNILSLILIVISLVFLIFKGLNYGVDFKGGTLIVLRTTDKKREAKCLSSIVVCYLITNF